MIDKEIKHILNKKITYDMIIQNRTGYNHNLELIKIRIGNKKSIIDILNDDCLDKADRMWCILKFFPIDIQKKIGIWSWEQCYNDIPSGFGNGILNHICFIEKYSKEYFDDDYRNSFLSAYKCLDNAIETSASSYDDKDKYRKKIEERNFYKLKEILKIKES